MEFEQAYASLNEQQKQAVDFIDGPLLVIAGPGTGKTQLLSVRVANILKQTDVSPDNILCLTFTDAAANNMRRRLASFIGPDAHKVQIHTYHSFGSYILQEHRPDLTSSIDELDRFNIIRKIQSTLKVTSLLRPDYQTKNIISAISNLKAAALDPDDIDKIVARNKTDNTLIQSAIADDLEGTKQKYPKNIQAYQSILEKLKDFVEKAPDYITDRVEPLAHVYYRTLAQILLEWDGETSIAKNLYEWRKKYFVKDQFDNYIFNDAAANAKLADLAVVMRAYTDELTKNGLYDYDDMILTAINLLKNDDEKRYNAQEHFQYILLDEYQDTNDAQSQLVALLTDNPANEGKPNIMAVGDDDQAIYGFQGANSSNFYDFDAKYHPTHILLSKNYRSSAAILELAHNVIEQGQNRFCNAPNVNIDKRITAENAPDETEIEYREFKSYQAEYSHVAQKIRDLLDSGVPGSKISIIAPRHKHLLSILPYLHALDIRVSYERRENILENPEIAELIEFCHFILALADRKYERADALCFHLFSLDCWKISIAEMYDLTSSAHKNRRSIIGEMLDDERPEHIKAAITWCLELATKVETYSAEHIIVALVEKIFTDIDDYDFYSNLNTLRDSVLTKTQGGKKMTLSEFVGRITAYQNAEIQLIDHSPYHESDSAVTIQTIHSSKGLEYDYVFLVAADNYNWADAKGNSDQLALPCNLEYVRHTNDSFNERIRLFFVAITRARAKLYMTYSLSDFSGKEVNRLKYLDTYEDGEHIYSRVIPEPFNEVIPGSINEITPHELTPSLWFDRYVPNDEVRKNLYRPKVEFFRLSPTQFNCYLDTEYAGPLTFFQSYIMQIPGEGSFALSYGNIVHEIMDEINKEGISNEEAYKRFVKMVNEADADEEERRDLLDKGEDELKNFLEHRGDQLRGTRADSERSFYGENIVLDDIPIGGKIDRIEIDEVNKTITVADFKTSKIKAKWSDKDSSTLKYKYQLYFYKFLIEGSRDYRDYKVTTGRIDFIQSDKFGVPATLELDFDPEEGDKIKTLIKLVYARIKDLDFPNTEEFSDSMLSFVESILEQ